MKLTDAEWSVLEILWSGERFSLKEIQANGWNKNTVHTYLTRMEKKGLVKRVKVLCDDRLKKIVLTEKSKQLGEKIRLDNIELDRKLASGFSTEELQRLVTYINRMKNNIQGEEKI